MWAVFTHQINFTLRCICTSQCFQDEDEIYKGWMYCFILKHCSKSILSYALPVLDPRKHWVCVCTQQKRNSRETSSHSLFLLSPWPTELPESSKHGPKMLAKSGLEVRTSLSILPLPGHLIYAVHSQGPHRPCPICTVQQAALLIDSSAWKFTNC